jgi:hypothetical protein
MEALYRGGGRSHICTRHIVYTAYSRVCTCVCLRQLCTPKSFEMRLCMDRRRLSFPLNIPMALPRRLCQPQPRVSFCFSSSFQSGIGTLCAIHHSLRPLKNFSLYLSKSSLQRPYSPPLTLKLDSAALCLALYIMITSIPSMRFVLSLRSQKVFFSVHTLQKRKKTFTRELRHSEIFRQWTCRPTISSNQIFPSHYSILSLRYRSAFLSRFHYYISTPSFEFQGISSSALKAIRDFDGWCV